MTLIFISLSYSEVESVWHCHLGSFGNLAHRRRGGRVSCPSPSASSFVSWGLGGRGRCRRWSLRKTCPLKWASRRGSRQGALRGIPPSPRLHPASTARLRLPCS